MKNVRTFVAVELSPEVQGRAANLIERLQRSGIKASWTKPQNMHLTLKFLGDTPETLLPDVCRAVTKACAGFTSFEMRFGGAGAFPSVQRAQTLWVGVQFGVDEISVLQKSIDEALYQLRYPKERRRFSPHITLGRTRGGTPEQFQALRQLLLDNAEFDAGVSIVEEVAVFSSSLGRETGPVYEAISHTPLL